MQIEEYYAIISGARILCARIKFEGATSVLPTTYGVGSTAYCMKGENKGKMYCYTSAGWEEQFTLSDD